MTTIRTAALAVALLTATPGFAQQAPPTGGATTGGATMGGKTTGGQTTGGVTAPGATEPGAERPGMMGGRMMGPGMMGEEMGPGMMGHEMRERMMGGGMMEMRRGMGMMGMMGAGMRMGTRHIEGRLAFLKTELAITDAQAEQWNGFAEAVRANAKAMAEMHQQAEGQGAPSTLPERLALQEKALAAHIEALTRTAGALEALYDVLSDGQKKVADEIVVGPMGMPLGMM